MNLRERERRERERERRESERGERVNQPCALDPQEHSFRMHVSSPSHHLLLPFHFFGRSSSLRRVFHSQFWILSDFSDVFSLFFDWKFCDRISSVSPFHCFFSIELNLHLPHQKKYLTTFLSSKKSSYRSLLPLSFLLSSFFHFFFHLSSISLSSVIDEKGNEMKNWCFFLLTKFNEKRREEKWINKNRKRRRTGQEEEQNRKRRRKEEKLWSLQLGRKLSKFCSLKIIGLIFN